MLIGYARTSTVEQEAGLQAQVHELRSAGCRHVHKEQISSVAFRHKLEDALNDLREGDVLVVSKLDRLARSMRDLLQILDRIEQAGASLRVLAMGLDTSTATGKLMLNVLGSVAEFERSLMLERQREGIAKAKADGKYKGRAPTARAKRAKVLELSAAGLGATEIARQVSIGRASVYRLLAACKAPEAAASEASS